MSADKRSVATDALATLGTIIDETGKRDAIHLAVEPIVAGEILYPGQHIGIVKGRATTKASKKLGIVDPFIQGQVAEGQRFWLIVYPRQITSLRHVWEHPDFVENEESKTWIENCARENGLSYDVLMGGADDWLGSRKSGGWGEHLNFGPLLDGASVPDEFWDHYEIVRGTTVEQRHRGSFFSCSC